MKLMLAAGGDAAEITRLLPMPGRVVSRLARPEDRPAGGRPRIAAPDGTVPCAAPAASTLLRLNADLQREARSEFWALAILWAVSWTALALAFG
jgi:hypothetical protein